MPKQKTIVECDTCFTQYDNFEDAATCESRHSTDHELIGVYFEKLTGFWGINRAEKQQVPSKVRVKYGPERHEHALYTLVQVGPKGL